MQTTKNRPIRTMLVDDHPIVRQGLRAILSSFDELLVEAEASSGREAIALAHEFKPDVVVMDISMPEMSGIEATAVLTRELPDVKVLALSMHDNKAYVQQAMKAGARGYLLKDSSPRDLASAISDVFAGSLLMTSKEAVALAGRTEEARSSRDLTPREVDVLRLIARGRTNKEIAVELGVGVRTVETHRENLIKKTGFTTVAELTRYAVELSYVELNPGK